MISLKEYYKQKLTYALFENDEILPRRRNLVAIRPSVQNYIANAIASGGQENLLPQSREQEQERIRATQNQSRHQNAQQVADVLRRITVGNNLVPEIMPMAREWLATKMGTTVDAINDANLLHNAMLDNYHPVDKLHDNFKKAFGYKEVPARGFYTEKAHEDLTTNDIVLKHFNHIAASLVTHSHTETREQVHREIMDHVLGRENVRSVAPERTQTTPGITPVDQNRERSIALQNARDQAMNSLNKLRQSLGLPMKSDPHSEWQSEEEEDRIQAASDEDERLGKTAKRPKFTLRSELLRGTRQNPDEKGLH